MKIVDLVTKMTAIENMKPGLSFLTGLLILGSVFFSCKKTNNVVADNPYGLPNASQAGANPSPGLLQIEIPAFFPKDSIVAPAGTVSVLCLIAIGVWDKETGRQHGSFSTQLTYEYNSVQLEKQIIPITVPTPKSSLIVLGATLEYTIMKEGKLQRNRNKAFMPAGIVNAVLL